MKEVKNIPPLSGWRSAYMPRALGFSETRVCSMTACWSMRGRNSALGLVSIYDHASAEAVRTTGRLPKSGKLIMVIECKFYTVSIPSAAPVRGFVGLIKDCAGMRLNAFVSNKASANLDKYFANKSNIEPFTDLEPGIAAAADRFVRIIEQALRKWAK